MGGKAAFPDDVAGAGEPGQIVLQRRVFDKSALALGDVQQTLVGQQLHRLAHRNQADAEALSQLSMSADVAARPEFLLQNLLFQLRRNLLVHGGGRIFVNHDLASWNSIVKIVPAERGDCQVKN